jgi:UPF0176 protein
MTHRVLAYYLITPIADPHHEVKIHKVFCSQYDLKGRLYISSHGINGQMSGTVEAAKAYQEWMQGREQFQGITFKIHSHHEHVFPRMTIKWKQKLVAIDREIDFSKRGAHLPPAEWKKLFESGEAFVLDVRNDYEWDIGRFKGAEKPGCNTFRDFEKMAEELEQKIDKENTPVIMYCTGGIRCELFSPLLVEKGFKKVYQLQGGVIQWGLEEGSNHFEGKLFVFDDRLQIPLSDEENEVVGRCHHCQSPANYYYNCANMDCNEFFICCPVCLEANIGCCQGSCQTAPRLRSYNAQSTHKPFRRWTSPV